MVLIMACLRATPVATLVGYHVIGDSVIHKASVTAVTAADRFE